VAHLGRNGRRSYLSAEITDKLVTLIAAGNPLETAAIASGVPTSTLYEWLTRDDAFRERIDRARAAGESRRVTFVSRTAMRDWRAAAWAAEREAPEHWHLPTVLAGRGLAPLDDTSEPTEAA
jgi:hypothetical protein